MENEMNEIPKRKGVTGDKDKWSSMNAVELIKELRKITMACNNGKGMKIPQDWLFSARRKEVWVERHLRDLLRFLYANLKEDYIAKTQIIDTFTKEEEEEGRI